MKQINFATHPVVQAVRLRKLRTLGRQILPQEINHFKSALADQENLMRKHTVKNQHNIAE